MLPSELIAWGQSQGFDGDSAEGQEDKEEKEADGLKVIMSKKVN